MPKPPKAWIERVVSGGGRQLRALLRRRGARTDDVPDLVQEVYLRLLRMPEGTEVSNPEAYVFAVAANLAREHAVLSGRLGRSVSHESPEVEPDLVHDANIEEELDSQQRAARLHAVLTELSPKCRAAVVLHYRDGLSYAEVGARLGVSSNMVKKYVMQALTHCRKQMGGSRRTP